MKNARMRDCGICLGVYVGEGGDDCVATSRAIQRRSWGARKPGFGAAVVLGWCVWLKEEAVNRFCKL